MKTKKNIFYFEKFDAFEKWFLGIYMLLTIALFIFLKFVDTNSCKYAFTVAYIGITHFTLIFLLYKSLRNMTVFITFNAIGLLHIWLYFYLNDDLSLRLQIGEALEAFKKTNQILILFQILRLVSLFLQEKELIVPLKDSDKDLFEEREKNLLDIVLFLLYLYGLFWIYDLN